MTRLVPPCYGCEDRQLKCHGSCERYKSYRKTLDDMNEADRKQRELSNGFLNREVRLYKRFHTKER